MSRIIRTRGNSYSLDAKNHIKLFKSISPSTHETKPLNHSRFKSQLKATQPLFVSYNHSQSYIHSKKRKLSLNKATKPNYSVNLQQHLLQQKHEKAKKLLKNGQYAQAIILLQSIIPHVQQAQLQKQLYFLLAISNNKIGKVNQTLMLMNLALRKYPNFVDGYLYRGNLYTRLKKYNMGLKDFQKALQLDSLNETSYIQTGKCYTKLDQINKALQIWKKGLQLIPESIELRLIIIQGLVEENRIQQSKVAIKQLIPKLSKKNSELWYIQGLLKKLEGKQSQACICFQQCLKYNNSQKAVKQAMHELLKIKITQRDYYSAFHSVNRIEFFNINSQLLLTFKLFLQATIMIMRKKYKEGAKTIQNLLKNHELDSFLLPLAYKFLAYAHFKLNNYEKTIQYYQSLTINQVDDITQYNLYLALGIVTVDFKNNFKKGIKYFEDAKQLFPHKVEPYIYISVTIIKQLFTEKKLKGQNHLLMILKALSYMNQGYIINSSSSNLLFHRTIIHFYLQNWEDAYKDINLCIEKAEQNLPKYFYLRGLCNACVKDFSKAINQYSICLSLDSQFTQGYLERAKCQFLTGETESGFRDLKVYMELNPQDLHVHKWIGDLLYEGRSYKDALRAYQQINDPKFIQLRKMKARCLFRLGDMQELLNQLKIIEKNIVKSESQTQLIQVDYSAIKLLNNLLKQQINLSSINQLIKTINTYLQKDKTGLLFQLIDCMNLLGVAAFYTGKYDQAYQSFALVLQLFQSSSQKYSPQLKSECSQQSLDLEFEKIVYNMVICKIMNNQWQKAATILKQELVQDDTSTSPLIKQMINLSKVVDSKIPSQITIQPNQTGSMFRKFKKVQTQFYSIKLKTRLFYGLYHDTVDDLYSIATAKQIIQELKPSYIDNMPEGPWIKRNQFGVVFTQQLLQQDQSSILDSSVTNSVRQSGKEGQELTQQQLLSKKKQQFLNMMKLDKSTEQKLNKLKNK